MSRKYPTTFWMANIIEIFERMAFYGFFALSSLYITGKVSDGCLGFTSEQRGFLQGISMFVLYILPVFMGALVERFGHKRMLTTSFVMLIPGYYLLGQFHSFWGFFWIFIFVAIAGAAFKPAITGTIARTTTRENASKGWGIFYMMVNIGGFFGPIVAGILRGWDWNWIFIASSGWIVLNLIILTIFYREPPRPPGAEAGKRTLKDVLHGMIEVIGNGRLFLTIIVLLIILIVLYKGAIAKLTGLYLMGGWVALNFLIDIPLRNLSERKGGDRNGSWMTAPMRLGNWRFGLFLLILSGFWTIYIQVFMTTPEYIRDFVDTTSILIFLVDLLKTVGLAGLAAKLTGVIGSGYQINPEFIINVNPVAIVAFQLLVTWAFIKRTPFFTMITGIAVTGLGMVLLALGGIGVYQAMGGATLGTILVANGWIVVLGIVVFSIGEMLVSPKAQEYIALIAPKDKVAIFMGYFFVGSALGKLLGGLLSGATYGWLARDMKRPDLMWGFFALFAVMIMFLFLAYNKFVIKGGKKNLKVHDPYMVHADDGEDVPEIPDLE